MTIVFWGTSEFAVPALEALHGAGFDLTIITMPDQPTGRKKILTPPPVKVTAEKLGLKVLQPSKLKDDAFFEEYKSLSPDLCVVTAYGKIIGQRYLDVPKHGFLNIHPSLLPKYRGPSPIQTAIMNGDTETGVVITIVDADMDHGPILKKQEVRIMNQETYTELHDRLAEIGAKLLVETIPEYVNGKIKPQEQDHSKATFCKMLEREDGRIDWSRSPQEIYNQIRALNPEPGTWTTWPSFAEACATAKAIGGTRSAGKQDKILNIKSAKLVDGKLQLVTLQLESKKETSLAEFLNGHPDFKISDCQ